MDRKICTALFLYAMLGVVVCAPVPEFESSQSQGEVQPLLPLLGHVLHRSPRQVNPNREQVINNIFQIPISTLTAVSTLLQSTRPITQRPLFPLHAHNNAQTPAPLPVFVGHGVFRGRQTIGARVAQVTPAADGSSFKI